jgi:hypothetical protein
MGEGMPGPISLGKLELERKKIMGTFKNFQDGTSTSTPKLPNRPCPHAALSRLNKFLFADFKSSPSLNHFLPALVLFLSLRTVFKYASLWQATGPFLFRNLHPIQYALDASSIMITLNELNFFDLRFSLFRQCQFATVVFSIKALL